jgi:hypothetical protein
MQLILLNRVFRLPLHPARQSYRTKCLHLLGYLWTVAILRTAIKETHCTSQNKDRIFAGSTDTHRQATDGLLSNLHSRLVVNPSAICNHHSSEQISSSFIAQRKSSEPPNTNLHNTPSLAQHKNGTRALGVFVAADSSPSPARPLSSSKAPPK